MMRSTAFPASALALAAALGLALVPASQARGPHGHPGARLEHAVEALDLDDATRAAVLTVIDGARPTSREMHASLRAAHEELRALIAEPGATEEAVLAKTDALGAMKTELRKHELRTLFQVRAKLTPDQQATLGEAMQRGKRCDGHGKRDGGAEL